MKAALVTDDTDLAFAADLDAVRACEFDRALRRLGAGGEQEDFLQALGRDTGETLDEIKITK